MSDVQTPSGRPYIGGQAVIEGVMMRSPHALSIAVRKPDKTFVVLQEPMQARTGVAKVPMLRGVLALGESMKLGYRAITFSASQQEVLAEGEASSTTAPSGNTIMALSMLLAVAFFIALPQLLAALTSGALGLNLTVQDSGFHLLTGTMKLLVFTAYLALVGRTPEMQRIFQYHGAEHKTIFSYEAGQELNVQNAQSWTTLHPRCGTTFMILVIIISIVLGAFLTPLLLPNVTGFQAQLFTLGLRVAMLPLIAAISFELQRFTARYCTTGPLRVLLWPGFLFQKITTREPSDDQVEVAIVAMQAARHEVRQQGVLTFASFDEAMSALA